MANLRSGLILDEGENLVMELEAEMWAESSNFFAKIIGTIVKFINLLLGNRRKGFLVITDKRVVEVLHLKALWVFNVGCYMRYLLPSSVKEVGYSKEGTCCGCFCQAYHIFYDSFTQRTSVHVSSIDSDAEAQKIVMAFYKAISVAQ